MPRLFESSRDRRPWRCFAALILLALLGMSNPACANGAKTPIRRAMPAQSVPPVAPRRDSSGTTLVFLGLLLAGAIVLRRTLQRRKERRRNLGPYESIQVLSRQRVDEELTIRILQVGPRLLIVGSSAQGLATLSEVDDPDEIATITGRSPTDESSGPTAKLFDGRTEIRPPVPAARRHAAPKAASAVIGSRSPEPTSPGPNV